MLRLVRATVIHYFQSRITQFLKPADDEGAVANGRSRLAVGSFGDELA